MLLREIAQNNNNRVLTEKGPVKIRKGVTKRTDPLVAQQNLTTFRFERILRGLFQNEQRMKLLSELMFLVVSASLNDELVRRAAELKFGIAQGVTNAKTGKKQRG